MNSRFVLALTGFWLIGMASSESTPAAVFHADLHAKMEKRAFQTEDGQTLPYRLWIPEGYRPGQKYPLVLFLHGAGERGNDNRAQLTHDGFLNFAVAKVASKTPCFIVAPQCPKDRRWCEVDWSKKTPPITPKEPSEPMKLVMPLLDRLCKDYSIDPARRYVIGMSMGGFGTFDLCVRRPDYFAAAVPICGGFDVTKAEQVASTPFWIFHGGADTLVVPGLSRAAHEALKKAGAQVKYTEYPGVGHNAWDATFTDENMIEWVFQQRRGAAPSAAPAKKNAK